MKHFGLTLVAVFALVLFSAQADSTNLGHGQIDYQKIIKLGYPSNTTTLIQSYGYDCENYIAETDDGYLLSLQRIPTSKPRKGVVLFVHGLTDSSIGICLNPPENGLPFILVDSGYEVWLANNRGNGYSLEHKTMSSEDSKFWAFSWDEMAQYDLPAIINKVLKVTGEDQLTYIGHSEGTIQAFACFLENHELAKKVNMFIALAPVTYVGNITPLFVRFLATINMDYFFGLFGIHEFHIPSVFKKLQPTFCRFQPEVCKYVIGAISGENRYLNETRMDMVVTYEPFPTSVQNMQHWAQGVRGNTFNKYDYGSAKKNNEKYGQPTPPAYDLSKWPSSLPITVFDGLIDGLADVADLNRLLAELPPDTVKYRFSYEDYGHLDFIMSTNLKERVVMPILDVLEGRVEDKYPENVLLGRSMHARSVEQKK